MSLHQLHDYLEQVDGTLYGILKLPIGQLAAELEGAISQYYSLVVDLRENPDDAGKKEALRRRKQQLLYLLERLQDLERGFQRRPEYHKLIDRALDYVSRAIRSTDKPASLGGQYEVETVDLGGSPLDVEGMVFRGEAQVVRKPALRAVEGNQDDGPSSP